MVNRWMTKGQSTVQLVKLTSISKVSHSKKQQAINQSDWNKKDIQSVWLLYFLLPWFLQKSQTSVTAVTIQI